MRQLMAIAICGLGLFLSAEANAADTCEAVIAGLSRLDLTKGAELVATQAGKTYKSLYDRCDSTDRFAGQRLPKSRKCSKDLNEVAFLKKFSDGTIVFSAKMAVDADGSPVSMGPNHSATDQPETSLTFDAESEHHFVNAEEVSFVVIPGRDPVTGISLMRDAGIAIGDLALITKNGKCSFGLVADTGPYFRLGEASIRAHADLGNPQCQNADEHPCKKLKNKGSGKGIASGVTYILLPGTRPSPLLSQTVTTITRAKSAAAALRFLKAFERPTE